MKISHLTFLALTMLALQGCGLRFVIPKKMGLAQPVQTKIRVAISDLDDPTGSYGKLHVKFEDEVVKLLSNESVRIIWNVDRLGTEGAYFLRVSNFYVPLKEPAKEADLRVTGSIQELNFGDAGPDMGAFAVFGLLGAAASQGNKAAKVSILMKVTAERDGKVLLSRRIEAAQVGRDIERSAGLEKAMTEVALRFVSYLFQTR